jgi:hypothetical protein
MTEEVQDGIPSQNPVNITKEKGDASKLLPVSNAILKNAGS